MKKLVALWGIVVALLLINSDSIAQSKKSTTKQGTIELIESKDGKYRFTVRDGDGKYLAGSPVGHATEKEAREAAESLRTVIATAKFVSKKSDSEGGEKKGNKNEK